MRKEGINQDKNKNHWHWRQDDNREKSVKQKVGYLKRLIKLVNLQQEWQKKKREKTQITDVTNERRTIPTDITWIIRECYKQLCTHRFDNFEMGPLSLSRWMVKETVMDPSHGALLIKKRNLPLANTTWIDRKGHLLIVNSQSCMVTYSMIAFI